jgi:hypothetical protein
LLPNVHDLKVPALSAARNLVHYLPAFDILSAAGVAAIKARLRGVMKWRAIAGVLARQRHADRARFIAQQVDLVANLIARPAIRIAALV